jgi:hypothetical protein
MDHFELHNLARNPAAVRSTAQSIKHLLGDAISQSELDFLTKLERFSDNDFLSIRQREFLWGLRERTSRKSTQGGYRASTLVQLLWEARYDLSYEDEEDLGRLRTFGDRLALSRSQWRWVFGLCRQLNIIDDDYISLS